MSVCLFRLFSDLNRAPDALFLTLVERAPHTQRDSPGGSTRRGQRTFPFEYYENRHTCLSIGPMLPFNVLPLVWVTGSASRLKNLL